MTKKIYCFIALVAIMVFTTSCTKNVRARLYGSEETIFLPKGEKLMEATWKGNSLWYLTEPMDSSYVPKRKIFYEESSLGVLNGHVIFVEVK